MRHVQFIAISFLVSCLNLSGKTETATGNNASSLTIYYNLGESIVPIRIMQYGETKDRVYINLHADEVTSIQAATSLLEKQGGLFIRIENNKQRNIRFRLRG